MPRIKKAAAPDMPPCYAAREPLLFFDGQRYHLIAWVVMPNHVYVLFQAIGGWTVAKIVSSWKKFTARAIYDYNRNQNSIPGKKSG